MPGAPWPTQQQPTGGMGGGWPQRPPMAPPGGSPWGNAPPAIASWLDANWGSPHQQPPGAPPPARPPLLSGRTPLGAGLGPLGGTPVNPRDYRNPGDPMSNTRMSPVPMSNPPPPGSLLAALFNAQGPLPPHGFPGAPQPTGMPMGVRGNVADMSGFTPAPMTGPTTPQGLNPQYQALFGLAPQMTGMPGASTNSTFGGVGKGWPFT
jgi:hypothetical protein